MGCARGLDAFERQMELASSISLMGPAMSTQAAATAHHVVLLMPEEEVVIHYL